MDRQTVIFSLFTKFLDKHRKEGWILTSSVSLHQPSKTRKSLRMRYLNQKKSQFDIIIKWDYIQRELTTVEIKNSFLRGSIERKDKTLYRARSPSVPAISERLEPEATRLVDLTRELWRVLA
jgi:hypothetical protein